MSRQLQVRTLGGLQVQIDDQPVTGFDSRKVPALLVYLAYTGRTFPREVLAEMLWEERTQAQALSNLRVALHSLNQTLGEYIEITRETAGLRAGADTWLDAHEFETQLSAAGSDIPRLDTALELYQGDFLVGFFVDSSAFEQWVTSERERLRLRAMETLDTLIRGHLSAGNYAEGIRRATQLLQLDPLREESHRCLMDLLWRSGQRGKALEQYDTCRRALRADLGIDPSPDITALYVRIRAGETPEKAAAAQSIRSYQLRDRIGGGSFGEVYRAFQPIVNREVAIKVIRAEFANHPDFIRRFEAEAQVVARLEHMNIVPLYDYWREPGGAYLVMRWLRGGSLRDRLNQGPLSLNETVRLVEQIAAALTIAHRNNVIHRDLKPANILLDEDGNAYLTDFGIAKALVPGGQATQEGALVGSPAYLSPEQGRSEPVTPRSDVYSFGLLLYELLTGQFPFPGALSPSALLYKQLNDTVPSLNETCPDLPLSLDDVIQCATAKDPAQRYPNALALAAAFRAAAGPDAALIPEDLHIHRAIRLPQERLTRTWTPADELVTMRNPYKGLRAFSEADSGDFFGRETLVEQLVARLAEDDPLARFLVVIGPSGSGKSSAVKAGLIPALRRGALPGSEGWFFTDLLPGPHPLEEIELALIRLAASPDLDLLPLLRQDKRGLLRAARRVLPEGAHLLLVIDQFEEVFTLADDAAEVRHLLDSLYTAATDPRSPIRVIITLRADFYDRPLLHPDFGTLVSKRTHVVLPLSSEELERAICVPAEQVGVRLEPGLAAAIVADVTEQPGALPMLQYALTELFDSRRDHTLTLNGYQTIGGAKGALARKAEEVHRALDLEEQEAARQIFLRLITLGEGIEDTRRRTLQAELFALGGSSAVIQAVIQTFDRSRLLTFDHDPITRGPTVEVAHEALLREWSTLRGWLDESRGDVRQERMLAAAVAEWEQAGRDSDFLLAGSRLAQFEDWADHSTLALTLDERAYLDTSVSEHQRRQAAEFERQAHELALQKQSANRLRYLVAGLAVFLAVAIALTLFALDAQSTSADERDKAQREASVRKSLALASAAQEALLTHNTDLAIGLALEAYSIDDPPIQAEQALAEAIYSPGTRRVLRDHTGPVSSVAYSPDGRFVLSGGGRELALEIRGVYTFSPEDSGDYSLRLWDAQTGEVIRRLEGHQGAVWDVTFSPDGTQALSASEDETMILWDVATGTVLHQLKHTSMVRAVDFSPNGRMALAGDDHQLILWDLVTGEPIRQLYAGPALQYKVWSVAFHPFDDRYALTGHGGRGYNTEGYMLLWDLETGKVMRQFDMKSVPNSVSFSPDGRYGLATGYGLIPGSFDLIVDDSYMVLWDLENGESVRRYVHGWMPIFSAAFSPDGRIVVSASADGVVILWDVESGEILHRLAGHENWIVDVAFSPYGEHLVTGSQDGTLRIWDTRNGAEIWHHIEHDNRASAVRFSLDGQFAVSSGLRDILVWRVATGEVVHRLVGHTAFAEAEFSEDGKTIFSWSGDQTIRLWDAATGQEISRIFVDGVIWDAEITPDGRYAVVSDALGSGEIASIKQIQPALRDMETGAVVRRFIGHTGLVFDLDLSPDGHLVATVSEDNTVRLWDITTGAEIHRMLGHTSLVSAIDFSPDGRLLASGGADRVIIVWDVSTGKLLRRLEGHSLRVRSIHFGPDNRTLISSSEDKLVIWWDVTTGQILRRFKVLEVGGAYAVRLSPDGNLFMTTSRNGDVSLWRLNDSPEQIIAWGQANRYLREFSCAERDAYDITPRCDDAGKAPTRTPYPTLPAPELIPTTVPLPTRSAPTALPLPTVTPAPTRTAMPTAVAELKGTLTLGAAATGQIMMSFGERPATRDLWTFEGTAGETLSIMNGSLGVLITLYDPEGNSLIEGSTPQLGPITLPTAGTYSVIVEAGSGGIAGPYTLTLNNDP